MKLELVGPTPRYAELLHGWKEDPEMRKFNPVERLAVEELADKLAKESHDLSLFKTRSSFLWFVRYQNQIVANITVKNINQMMLSAELGYGVAPSFRSQGIASWAIYTVTQLLFEQSPLRKLIAYVHAQNIASRKAIEKVGYRQEGFLREHYLIETVPSDEILYAILRSDPLVKTVKKV